MKNTFGEDDLLPISALQHLIFCERQCALVHLEGIWAENRLTVEGQHLHSRIEDGETESRGDVRIVRSLPVRSLRLGLAGKADVVEFQISVRGEPCNAFPVEYKRGRPKKDLSDRMQLCAQALCLEEMLAMKVSAGALFYGKRRRRLEVSFDPELRQRTEESARRLHKLFDSRQTPKAVYEPKCDRCSLLEVCMPERITKDTSAYLDKLLNEVLKEPSN